MRYPWIFHMHPAFLTGAATPSLPIWFATSTNWTALSAEIGPHSASYAKAAGFEPKPGKLLLLPNPEGGLAGVVFGVDPDDKGDKDPFLPGSLPGLLPAGRYRFAKAPNDARLAALAFALGSYHFGRYRKAEYGGAQLELAGDLDGDELTRIADGVTLARDLINTPANDLGPAELAEAAQTVGRRYDAAVRVIVGDDLLSQNFPLIHAVGRASVRAPRLIDLRWGDLTHPKVTLIGKGVCFDTGGLDIKPDSAMLLMKKDMGGAACALALAHMIMDRRLPVRLRLLIPAVENAISGTAFRPRDVYRSRKGLTVEIGNTDAEGRLILADALALADEDAPDVLIDLATLTGAARVALGPEVPPFYTDDDALADELAQCAGSENDPLWRLPLWRPYDAMLESKVADINNVATGGFAGSITAALFLRRFVSAARAWAHFDIYAWNPSAKPARPEGGECQAARALYALLKRRYG
jgi:leucyl aminopeptidase